jgi:hypothetical protein
MGPQILKKLYSCIIMSVLTIYITAWYGNCSASESKALQRVVRTAQYITGAKLPAIHITGGVRGRHKDSSHPSHRIFSLLPHGKLYRSAMSRSNSLLNSFYRQAIRLLNNSSNGDPDYLHLPPPFDCTLLLLTVYYPCIVTSPLPTCTYYLD